MMDLTTSILLFLPLFLVINLCGAIPGRRDLGAAMRHGLRHFAIGTGVIIGLCVAFQLLFEGLLGHGPIW